MRYDAVRGDPVTPEDVEDSVTKAMQSKEAAANQLLAARARIDELRAVVAAEKVPVAVKIGVQNEIQEYHNDIRGLEEKQKQLDAFIRAKSGQTGFMGVPGARR
jgi:hypothetical protein